MTRRLSSVLAFALLVVAGSARAADGGDSPSSLDTLRERFKAGMDQYNRGAAAEAIAIWESIYAELGPEKGYRLAFNIASAYEQLSVTHAGTPEAIRDASKASKLYETYVFETTRRREAGETLEPLIAQQEIEAKQHLGSLRIEGDPSVVVRLDDEKIERHANSVVWLVPARHVVTFHPGRADEQIKSVDVPLASEVVVRFDPNSARPRPPPDTPRQPRFVTREERPFDKTFLFVGAGVTLVSVVVPLIFYSNAWAVEDDYVKEESRTRAIALRDEYSSARRTAYAALAIPAILGAATLGLTAYWFLGTKETRVPVTLNGALLPSASGASFTATATARF